MKFHFSKLQACKLQPSAICVFKTSEIMSPVFLSAETDANWFSTEKLL